MTHVLPAETLAEIARLANNAPELTDAQVAVLVAAFRRPAAPTTPEEHDAA